MITPETIIKLCNVPIAADQKNQIDFASAAVQYAWFNSHVLFTFEEMTYQRMDNAVEVEKTIDDLWAVNYCLYKNETLPDKWFYAFVTRMEYVSEDVTRLYLDTDVYQTWLFEFQVLASFVEREHEDEVT